MPNFADLTATIVPTTAFTTDVNLVFTGTAIVSDYTTSASSINIVPNTASGNIRITAVTDTNIEIDETIIIDVDTVTNGLEDGSQQITLNIIEDYIEVIMNYADLNSNPLPTIDNYVDTGVTGVISGNLVEVNAAIDALIGVDVDTVVRNTSHCRCHQCRIYSK